MVLVCRDLWSIHSLIIGSPPVLPKTPRLPAAVTVNAVFTDACQQKIITTVITPPRLSYIPVGMSGFLQVVRGAWGSKIKQWKAGGARKGVHGWQEPHPAAGLSRLVHGGPSGRGWDDPRW